MDRTQTRNMQPELNEPNDLLDHDDTPIIDGLPSSSDNRTPPGQESKTISTETLRKIKSQRETIRKLQKQLQRSTEALYASEQQAVDLNDTLQATRTSPATQRALETPGPHRLQERAQRPEDIAYQERLQQQSEREQAQQEHSQQETNQPQMMLDLVKQLAKAMKDTNTSDITEPSKFSGADHHWDEWNYQLRSYLEAKGWLATYDHPTGPGTAGFDTEINKKLYNKLTMLCTKGTAITYLRKAAEFDGWGAGKELRLRYHGFSKQRGKTLRNTVETLRHVHGTNITKHIDLFE